MVDYSSSFSTHHARDDNVAETKKLSPDYSRESIKYLAREFLGRFSVLPTEGVVTYVELVGKREISQKLLAID